MATKKIDELKSQQKLPFMFEVQDGETGIPVYQYVLPFNPENYQIDMTPRASITYTQGGAFEDRTGMALSRISMSGTFGFQGTVRFPTPGPNLNSIGGLFQRSTEGKKGPAMTLRTGEDLTAWDLYQEMEGLFFQFYEMFGTYDSSGQKISERSSAGSDEQRDLAATKYYDASLQKQAQEGEKKPKLVFYNFSDKQYLSVQINKFVIRRSLQRRFLYQYDIQMTVLGDASTGTAQDALADWREMYEVEATNRLGLLQAALKAYSFISTSISTLSNLIDSAVKAVETIRTSVLANVRNVVDLRDRIVGLKNLFNERGVGKIGIPYSAVISANQAVDSALALSLATDGLPHEYVRELRMLKRELFIYEANQHLFVTSPTTAPATIAATGTEIVTGAALSNPALPLDVPETTLFGADPLAGIGQIAREETVVSGVTIASIAAAAGVPWQHLAAVNDLEYPYVAEENPNGLKILVPGDKILIPGAAGSPPLFGQGLDYDRALFGEYEYLDENGEQHVSATGDSKTTAGLDNLEMQVVHQLTTLCGELRHLKHPKYGCLLQTFIGKPDLDVWRERTLLEPRRVLLADPRVAAVKRVTLVGEGGTYRMEVALVPVARSNETVIKVPILA